MISLAALPAALMAFLLFTGPLTLFQTSARFDLGLEPNRAIFRQVPLWLTPGSQVSQEFTANYPGLYRVSLFLTRRPNTQQPVTVSFRLKQTCAAANDLRQVTAILDFAALPDDGFYPFTFAPLEQSTGQSYCLVVEPAANTPVEPVIGVWAARADVYPGGVGVYLAPPEPVPAAPVLQAAQSAIPPEGLRYRVFLPVVASNPAVLIPGKFDVGFEAYYAGRWEPTLQALANRLTAHKPYVWGWPGWYTLLALLGGGLVIRLILSDAG